VFEIKGGIAEQFEIVTLGGFGWSMAINGGGLTGISILAGSIGFIELEQPGIFMLVGLRSDMLFFLLYTCLLLKLNKNLDLLCSICRN
jgi:hypothetical protein